MSSNRSRTKLTETVIIEKLVPLLLRSTLLLQRIKLAKIKARTNIKIRIFQRLPMIIAINKAIILITIPSQKMICSFRDLHVGDSKSRC